MAVATRQMERQLTQVRAPCTTDDWPVDPVPVYAWRQQQVLKIRKAPALLIGARHYYANRPVDFINHWFDTYDPRKAGTGLSTKVPFVLFRRQAELVEFIVACLKAETPGLVEKARDMGATWVLCAVSVWLWLFWPGASVGWGSRKEQLVDKIGDPDSIFEKMRMLINGLPRFFWPEGFNPSENMSYMRIVNPETGATITGEAGDNIGRGGRKLIYFKDESAWYERPEKVEAALADNTRVPIDLSSVNGLGNVFHRRREAGVDWDGRIVPGRVQVFVLDWRDHPAKDKRWYDERKARAEAEGLQHVFAQEVDRDYSASVEGTLIRQEWVQAAIDAHLVPELGISQTGIWVSALDVADGGGDTNAQASRQGIILRELDEWGARDTAVTARRAIANVTGKGPIELQYDSVSVGSGVKAEVNNIADMKRMPKGVKLVPWNAGGSVLNPEGRVNEYDDESPKNKDFFANMKAQAWWELSRRFYRTWRAREEGAQYGPDQLISIDSRIKKLRQLEKELCQVTGGPGPSMKMLVNKTPDGTKSPNCGDAVVMAYWPVAGGYDISRFVNG